jgi:hypothetical protein
LASASTPDPQVKTNHPWYPGELACSTFDRLFKTQAALYQRVTGRSVESDEDKALASWYWRNLHYWHGEEGRCDLFGQGFDKSDWNREYWTGLFAHGFSLCGTTHSQWTAEMNALLGHCHGRAVGVSGHNSFEVFLTGGAYGQGKWALLDHDISTIIFDDAGRRLLGIQEIVPLIKTLKDPNYKPHRQRGWRVAGLHDDDAGGVYTSFRAAEYLSGYAGPPPRVHLRAGESLRRYLRPGLEDGKTFVFWGMNYNTANIPGPERSRTWVNQPQKMFGAKRDTGHTPGQARYANAVFTYVPDFTGGTYKQGVVSEDDQQVTFEFTSPYVVAATPASPSKWGVYEDGAKGGLVVTSKVPSRVQLSVDRGRTWSPGLPVAADASADLTDLAKGNHQYWLRINSPAGALKDSALTIRTVCQCNATTIPHLKDGPNAITFESSGLAHVSAGPTLAQVATHVVEGKIGSRSVTLELAAPRGEKAVQVYAASWQASGNPPNPKDAYRIDYSTDGGKTWSPVVKDWRVQGRPPEPPDYWSQSFTWGDTPLPAIAGPVHVRFTNTGGKTYRKVEAHLAYRPTATTPTTVTFAWTDKAGKAQMATQTYPAGTKGDMSWKFDAGENVETTWVEYAAR